MSHLSDLLEVLKSDWAQPTWTSPTRIVKVKTEQELSIVPSDPPMLKIEYRDPNGIAVFIQTMNLPLVDKYVGELIRMRDLLESMEKKTPE